MSALNIYIGWDPRETVAWQVLAHSILRRATHTVNLIPLRQETLREEGVYRREVDLAASTEFSLTRFLVPHLSNYEGYSLFLDCDMLCLEDISRLFDIAHRDPSKSVWVAKHDYVPRSSVKMDGQKQEAYTCKNWSSVMLFNNAACRTLTPQHITWATPAQLHQFAWVDNNLIGELPKKWNWLSGEYEPNPDAALLHYTLGGPWFPNIPVDADGKLWVQEYYSMADRNPHFIAEST